MNISGNIIQTIDQLNLNFQGRSFLCWVCGALTTLMNYWATFAGNQKLHQIHLLNGQLVHNWQI
jgi:hypothetical protein